MADPNDPLSRIADALDRIAPPPAPPIDPAAHGALVWRGGTLAPAARAAALPLDVLVGIDRQRDALLGNLRRHAAGHAAHDVLLWGARGSGKSALVKSVVAAIRAEGGALTLVEVGSPDTLPALFDRLAAMPPPTPHRFALFLDDLGVDEAGEARALRSLLQGGAEERPANTRLLVTANRRHLMPRDMAAASAAINPRDAADDELALADRFGLSLGFHVVDQDGYLAIVERYAAIHDLPFDPADAIGWATRRGSRSGRVAWQYVVELAGRAGRAL
jgi:predicted AAA+ superfamily ATPase